MKKLLVSLMTLGMVVSGAPKAQAKAPQLKTVVIESEKLTRKMLTTRKNKKVIIEKIYGTCVNNKGDGRTSDGYYISYKGIKGVKKGSKVKTLLTYNPKTNFIDDVIKRKDSLM